MQPKLCMRTAAVFAVSVLTMGADSAPGPVLPLTEVEAGLKGEGWSVFAGSEPEPFDVEVLGVWHNVGPDTSYILTRLSGHGLEETGVIAGMSGSPVYVEDRLMGAVAFSWALSQGAVAGVTPIEAMRRMANSQAEGQGGPAGPSSTLPDLFERVDARARLASELGALVRLPEGQSSGLLWSSSGLGVGTRDLLAEAVGPVVSAGQATALGEDLQPGDAVAAVLIDGDLRLAATGTVTDRYGDSILAFGHPFLSMGDIAVPMATAEIVTVVPSLINSFKVGNIGRTIGRFDRDRPSGVRGTLGALAPTLPVTIEINGGRTRHFSVRIARVAPIAGPLVATTLLGALDATTGAGGERELELVAEILLDGRPPLLVRQVFDGPAAAVEAAVHMLSLVGYLENNVLADVDVSGIDIRVDQTPGRRTTRILAAHPSRRVVRAGSSVTLNVELDPYRGESRRHRMEIDLPRDLRPGRYVLLIGDGTSIDAARLELEQFSPVRISQALGFLGGLHSRSELAVLGVAPDRGLNVDGAAMPRLPGSIREIWDAGDRTSVTALGTAIRQEEVEELGVPLTGLVRIDLEVERGEG